MGSALRPKQNLLLKPYKDNTHTMKDYLLMMQMYICNMYCASESATHTHTHRARSLLSVSVSNALFMCAAVRNSGP